MKSLNQYITEHYVTALSREDMIKYAPIVWDMLSTAYKPIGGLAGMDSPEQLIKETDLWKMVRRHGEILAVRCYAGKRGGRKSCYCATNGTKEGKEALYNIIDEDVKMIDRHAWAECSEKMEYIYLKHGMMPIPADKAKIIMHDKEFLRIDPDGFHYDRKIGDKVYTKLMVGNYSDADIKKIIKKVGIDATELIEKYPELKEEEETSENGFDKK